MPERVDSLQGKKGCTAGAAGACGRGMQGAKARLGPGIRRNPLHKQRRLAAQWQPAAGLQAGPVGAGGNCFAWLCCGALQRPTAEHHHRALHVNARKAFQQPLAKRPCSK